MSARARADSLRTLACLAAVLGLSLGGCGQKGPLYLPDTPAQSVPPTAHPATGPAADPDRDRSHANPKTQKPDNEPQS